MLLFRKHLHHQAKQFEVMPFRGKPQSVSLKERDNFGLELFPTEYFEPLAVLGVWPRVFLKVHAPAPEKTLQRKEDFLVALDEF